MAVGVLVIAMLLRFTRSGENDVYDYVTTAIFLAALAAVIGLVIASRVRRRRHGPNPS